ncbi:hypothetical protein [Janibacter sp. LM]|uniref:hypothetical protein n=1 Tax=Janibacter sp. LM TaxID=3144845 RepID=UPI0031F69344
MSTRHRAECDCGWAGTYDTPAKAAYALRRHSCDAHRARQDRAARVAARKAASGPARDCTHLDEHGQPRHQHGERNAYVIDKCRCRSCRDAASTYERRRAKDRAYGRDAYIDAAPVRAHVQQLQAQGMGWKRVADAAGLERSVVWKLIYGDPTRGLAPTKRVMPKTRDAILAVTLDLAPGRIIDGTGTRRRLQALVAIGWSMGELARRLDIRPSNIGATIHGHREVTVATATRARDLYDELWDTPAPPSGRHGSVPTRARAYADRMGWVPPLAWDDETIDDPDLAGQLRAAFHRNAIAQGHDQPTRDGLPPRVRDRGRRSAA